MKWLGRFLAAAVVAAVAAWLAALLMAARLIDSPAATAQLICNGEPAIMLGTFHDHDSPEALFNVRNAGNGTVNILRLQTGCGCASVEIAKASLAPGESSDIRIRVLPFSLSGDFSKNFFAVTEPPSSEPLELTLAGHCRPFFTASPRWRQNVGRLAAGSVWDGTFTIAAHGAATLENVRVTTENCVAEATFEPSGTSAWRVPIRLTCPERGNLRCRVAISVTEPKERPPLILEVSGKAGEELLVTPEVLTFTADSPSRVARIRLEGRAHLAAEDLQISPENWLPFITLQKEESGGVMLRVTLPPAELQKLNAPTPLTLTAEGAEGTLTLQTAQYSGSH